MSLSFEALFPPELLRHILKKSSPRTLPQAALVCRRWNIIATPFLYRYVYYSSQSDIPIQAVDGRTDKKFAFPDWSSPNRQSIGSYDRQERQNAFAIVNYESFLRTMEESEKLRALVKGVSVFWKPSIRGCRLMEVLRSSNLNIHVSVAELLDHDPDADPDEDPENCIQKNIISFHIPQWYYFALSDELRVGGGERNMIYDLCAVPQHLESVSIAGKREWAQFEDDIVPLGDGPDGEMEKTLGLTSLSLTNSTAPSDDLYELLTWPKALRSFHFEIDRLDADGSKYMNHNREVDNFMLLEFQMALYATHSDTLEELFIFGEDCIISDDIEDFTDCFYSGQTLDLHNFPRLKRLGLPVTWLSPPESLLRHQKPSDDDIHPLRMSQILPPNLEELQIGFPGGRLNEYIDDIFPFAKTPDIPTVSHEQTVYFPMPGELIQVLKGVCQGRARYPKLREVVLWHVCPLVEGSCDLDDVEYWPQLVRFYRASKIKLYSVCNNEPPLFSG
ncbi:hypothetical protein HYFRA_00007284 [Hymenoscyphus fraxineus]|uniref:F-box domain-containing protein n=1 Tax=Hymenoscyphus fraxineus TaxID=746836 RepID=A0A9N9KTP5_9HELO|nr:hypothetical protein HYFRA_00007284 [Hymenoscyphus fraxineus]